MQVEILGAHTGVSAEKPAILADGPGRVGIRQGLEVELTKTVHLWRQYPEPDEYSYYGGGLPSSVHVFGVTLERPAVDFDFEPDSYAHIWTAPAQPSYTVTLRNTTDQPRTLNLTLTTASHDTVEKTTQHQSVTVPAHATQPVKLALALKRYGYHHVDLAVQDDQGRRKRSRSLAYLHPDTRERGNWEEGKGMIYGFWDWGGGHLTPSGLPRLQVAADLGIETRNGPFYSSPPAERAFAAQHQMVTHFLTYMYNPFRDPLDKEYTPLSVPWDASKPDLMAKVVVEGVKTLPFLKPDPTNKPELAIFLGEPNLGEITFMSLPEYYGEPPHQLTPDEEQWYKKYLDLLLIAGGAIKKEWPSARIIWGYGCANFPIPFLERSKEAAALMDGPALDMAPFVRLPEAQMCGLSIQNHMWQLKQKWTQYSPKPWPKLMTVEGPCIAPSIPGSLTQDEEAENTCRTLLTLMGYNVTQFTGCPVLFRCAWAWGEHSYGAGLSAPLPLLNPNVGMAAFATMTRQINRVNFVKWVPTGSNTVFCYQFKHYKTGELLHVMWTLRGTRPVTLTLKPGENAVVYDSMDNDTALTPPPGHNKVTLTVTTAPCFIHGLTADPQITLGEPDQSDARPGRDALKIASPGDGTWRQVHEHDDFYENSDLTYERRFLGNMSAAVKPAPPQAAGGGQALAIHLEKQDKQRDVMPYYTMLVPSKPVVIPGQATHLGIWVQGHSDWGRVVYFLRDAKGQPWVSVGTPSGWEDGDANNDTHAWSQFCFDGWRDLKFELPANAPWDCYRENGTVWWGGPGTTAVVELPLTIEKIAIERRDHVIYADTLVPADPTDVLLGDLYAEYAKPADRTDEAVKLSKLRMPEAVAAAAGKP